MTVGENVAEWWFQTARQVRRGTARAAVGILIGISSLIGSAGAQNPEDIKNWTLDDLRPGTRVEVDGRLRADGVIEAFKITVERPDDAEEVKGTIASIDYDRKLIVIPPFTIRVDAATDIDDESETDSYDFEELQVGWRLQVDLNQLEDGTLLAVEIAVDKVPDNDKIGVVEVEAWIDNIKGSTDDDTLTIELLGKQCKLGEGIEIRAQEGATKRNVSRSDNVEDTVKGLIRFNIGSTQVIVGGELQTDYELRDQYQLDRRVNKDSSAMGGQLSLQAEWYLNSDLLFFIKGSTQREETVFDENRDPPSGEDSRLTEVYLKYNIPKTPFLAQVGRQRFDDDREWFYDAELDGARLTYVYDDYSLEYSRSELLRDNHLQDQFTYQIFTARYDYARKSAVTFHVIDVVDDSAADQSPFYVGIGAVGRWKGDQNYVKYWGHYAYADGVTGFEELSAQALDFGGAIQWRKAPFAPYLFGGYAWASGDKDPTDRTNRQYQATGLEDNNDKLFGVASYRYYGEMFRPELSNMKIVTLGAGIRPNDSFSVDFIFHQYTQSVASTEIRGSRLRASPDGIDKDLGIEFDLVLGLADLWGSWDLELDFGYFIPGDAFRTPGDRDATTDDAATWVAIQVEYKF